MPSICEESVYSRIFREYSKLLYNLIYYKCGNKDEASDLVQEAFLKLWINCANVDFEKAKAYVFRTANNLLLNQYDHNKVVLNFQNKTHSIERPEDPSYILEKKEFSAQLQKAISELPEKQRVAFLLSRIDKKTYKEIAEILGISKQAVEKRIYSALNSLRLISKNIK